MATIEVNGKTVELDEEAYLVNLSEWDKDIAIKLAGDDDLELTDAHWEVINFLRGVLRRLPDRPGGPRADQGHWQETGS